MLLAFIDACCRLFLYNYSMLHVVVTLLLLTSFFVFVFLHFVVGVRVVGVQSRVVHTGCTYGLNIRVEHTG